MNNQITIQPFQHVAASGSDKVAHIQLNGQPFGWIEQVRLRGEGLVGYVVCPPFGNPKSFMARANGGSLRKALSAAKDYVRHNLPTTPTPRY